MPRRFYRYICLVKVEYMDTFDNAMDDPHLVMMEMQGGPVDGREKLKIPSFEKLRREEFLNAKRDL